MQDSALPTTTMAQHNRSLKAMLAVATIAFCVPGCYTQFSSNRGDYWGYTGKPATASTQYDSQQNPPATPDESDTLASTDGTTINNYYYDNTPAGWWDTYSWTDYYQYRHPHALVVVSVGSPYWGYPGWRSPYSVGYYASNWYWNDDYWYHPTYYGWGRWSWDPFYPYPPSPFYACVPASYTYDPYGYPGWGYGGWGYGGRGYGYGGRGYGYGAWGRGNYGQNTWNSNPSNSQGGNVHVGRIGAGEQRGGVANSGIAKPDRAGAIDTRTAPIHNVPPTGTRGDQNATVPTLRAQGTSNDNNREPAANGSMGQATNPTNINTRSAGASVPAAMTPQASANTGPRQRAKANARARVRRNEASAPNATQAHRERKKDGQAESGEQAMPQQRRSSEDWSAPANNAGWNDNAGSRGAGSVERGNGGGGEGRREAGPGGRAR